jgi:hypothetical protein
MHGRDAAVRRCGSGGAVICLSDWTVANLSGGDFKPYAIAGRRLTAGLAS